MYLLLSIIIGYLLGSVSPSWILGKLLKGIDIRDVGTHNAGTTNTFRQLGWGPAALTATYDLLKGLLAIYIAYLLGIDLPWILLAGIAAFFGHVFPFYLGFRGGQGNATWIGILIYLIYLIFIAGNVAIPWVLLVSIVLTALIVFYIARDDEIIGVAVLPLAILVLAKLLLDNPYLRFEIGLFAAIFIYMWFIALANIRNHHLLELKPETKKQLTNWRTLARPLAILLPIIYLVFGKVVILWLLGGLGIILISLDISRLVSSGINIFMFKNAVGFFKEKEKGSFSSMTYFMVACFLSILLFDQNIAILAISFLIFGDLSVKFFGAQYSKIFLWQNRSLEALLSYFAFALFFGLYIGSFLDIPIIYPIIGALAAALTDSLSIFGIDDNFTVALISGAVMQSVKFFI